MKIFKYQFNKNIVLFVYSFPHKKTLKGMQLIKSYGFKNITVIAAPKIELKFRQSKNRISVREEEIVKPYELAKEYGWKAIEAEHNSKETVSFLNKIRPEIGVILGARILSEEVIKCFSKGIVNFHPGVLPENRGLDNLKWAIFNNIPQGVTTHFIDKNIDEGVLIKKDIVDVEHDDSVYDINSKLLDSELKHLDLLLKNNFSVESAMSLKSKYPSQKAVTNEIDEAILNNFFDYKINYPSIVDKYKNL